MKYLILVAILYLAYRFVLQPSLNPPSEPKQPNIQEREDMDNGEYIDYEEVD
jgi:hypothetical protein